MAGRLKWIILAAIIFFILVVVIIAVVIWAANKECKRDGDKGGPIGNNCTANANETKNGTEQQQCRTKEDCPTGK